MVIIGVAGGTGSGKTTVVNNIVRRFGPDEVALIPQDSYYNDTTPLTMEERHQINFDHPNAFDWTLLSQQIAQLRAGQAIEQPTYSYLECNRQAETVHVEPREVVIVEGILALYDPALRDLMDLKVFVDTDPDERLIRVIQRDIVERGRTVKMVTERYERVLKPMHSQFVEPTKCYADLIVPQGGSNRKAINLLCNYIHSILSGTYQPHEPAAF